MIFLFDTSAIINLIQRKKKDAAVFLKGQYTSDLAYYETGNVIWKLYHRKLLSSGECKQLLADIGSIWEQMKIITFSPDYMTTIFQVALSQKLTFYDASNFFYRRQLGAILITDDAKLHNVAMEARDVDYSVRFDQPTNP